MTEYDISRWIELFRMSKESLLDMCAYLRPLITRQNTNYREAVYVEACIACALYKLVNGVSLLTCSEMFGIGVSTAGLVLKEVVLAITVVYKDMISWPAGERMRANMLDYKRICGLPSVHGAIDATHFEIKRPKSYPEDYYYFKSEKYAITMQAVVDSKKRFTDICVGMPSSVNDSRILRRSHLYRVVAQRGLMNMDTGMLDDIPSYIIGNKGYPCLSWLLVPFKSEMALNAIQKLYNRRLSRGRAGVENAFGFLKLTFRELQNKIKLDLKFVPDVIYACCILHNILLGERNVDIQELLRVITLEAEHAANDRQNCANAPVHNEHDAGLLFRENSGEQNRIAVTVYVAANHRG
jgi:hypothetical protein